MKKLTAVAILATLFLSACTTQFKKTADGTEYKVDRASGGALISQGNFMTMQIVNMYKDSILQSTVDQGMPQMAPYDTASFPPAYKEIFNKLHVGDSITIRMSTDSIEKNGNLPPFMKKGEYYYTTYKFLNVYATQADAEKANTENMKMAEKVMEAKKVEQVKKDEDKIKEYLAKNNIQATRAPGGTYVQVIQPGTGAAIDTSMFLRVNYTGKTLAGKMFDSNTDPAKGHVEPFMVNMTNDRSMGGVIEGWKDGMSLLKKGSKAKFYIPSALGYGAQGSGADIGPNEILVFDIDVLDIVSKAQAKSDMDAMQQKMQAMQQQYMDSMQKANPQGAPGQ